MLRVLCLLCVGAAVAQVHPPVGPSEKRPFTSYFTADQETSLNGTIGYIKADSGGKLYEYQQLIFGAANAPLPAKPGKNGTKAVTEEFVLNLSACAAACRPPRGARSAALRSAAAPKKCGLAPRSAPDSPPA